MRPVQLDTLPAGLLDSWLLEFIATMEKALRKQAIKYMKPMQAGEVQRTYAETSDLRGAVGFAPTTSLNSGFGQFVTWATKHWAV